MNDDSFLIDINDINIKSAQNLVKSEFFVTVYSSLFVDSFKCVAKFIKSNQKNDNFLKYVSILQTIKHPGIIPFIGYSKPNEKNNDNVIVLKQAPFLSLQYIFKLRGKGKTLHGWNLERQYLFIYGIAKVMEYLHSKEIIHQRLKPSNILIDENFEPQITDFSSFKYFSDMDFSDENLIKYNSFYYIDPYILIMKSEFQKSSDVFSFAIIVLQILSNTVEIYNNCDDKAKLLTNIRRKEMPIIPDFIPYKLSKLMLQCLSHSPNDRPSFSKICIELEKVYRSMEHFDIKKLDDYKTKIESAEKNLPEELNYQINEMKEKALLNDVDMMFLYAKERFEGKNCQQNIIEAVKFFRMAANKGHPTANDQLKMMLNHLYKPDYKSNKNDDEKPSKKDENPKEKDEKQENQNNHEILADDQSYDEKKCDITQVINNIDELINTEEKLNFDKEGIKKQNFIFTKGAEERLQKLYNYIKVGVPVLLEGPTGTSKTLSSEIVCKSLNYDLIRFNLSSETKTQDLLGRYVGDEKSWAGISLKDGPFYQAFTEGKVLLLDEINLASASVLQCIEEALDSGVLSIEIPGRPLKKVAMNPNFRVIATQNPNKGSYANKRQNLGLKFYSRFQIINFPAFKENELLEIAEGLAEQFGYQNSDVIKNLVKFHIEWSEYPDIIDDPQCFTIREIAATVKALSQDENIYDTIMTIYGARYQQNIKNKLQTVLKKHIDLNFGSKEFIFLPFPYCFENKTLKYVVKSTLFSLNNGRNIILTGKEGCGKTQVAMWIADYYNKQQIDNNNQQTSYFCVCTEEIKVSDLVGHQAPSGKTDGTSELIKWQDGFLTKAIKQGKCAVLESIDEAPSTITERLNGLLDQKYDGQKKYFDVPENSANPKVLIKDSFRILATSNIEKISQMSPAFLNRFEIIVLENQIDENINEDQFKQLITILLDRYCSETIISSKEEKHSIKNNNFDDILDVNLDDISDDSDDHQLKLMENSQVNQNKILVNRM